MIGNSLRTVKFGDYDSWLDFGLIRTSTTIGKPEARTNTVEVEGMDGVLDFSEYFGEIMYDNRELELEFSTARPVSEFPRLYSDVCNAIDGKRLKVVLSEDPDYYWMGRVSVSEWKSNGRIGTLTISVDCEPYKYKAEVTRRTIQVSGTAKALLTNLRKRVVPTFELDAAMTIAFGTGSHSATVGTWSSPEIVFEQGVNEITFTGTGTVVVSYQERGL